MEKQTRCPRCSKLRPNLSYLNMNTGRYYRNCDKCRHEMNVDRVKRYRNRQRDKKNLDASQSPAPIPAPLLTTNPDLYIKIKDYIIGYMGAICGPCGYNKYDCALDIYNPSADLQGAIYIYSLNLDALSWAEVVNLLPGSVIICANCMKALNRNRFNLHPVMFEHNTDNIPLPPTEYLIS